MPHYLTFGIRIPAALADFFSSIAFVRVTKEQQLDEISRTITDLSNTLKELQVIFKEQTTKSEDPAQKSIEHVSSIDVSAKGQQADCSVFGKLPFELSNMTKQPTEQSPGNKLSPIGQPVDSSFFGRTPFEMRNMFKEAAEQGTGKVSPIGQQIDCPFFSKLPSEIRNMIYNHVLVSSNPIRPVYQLVGDYRAERRSRRRAGVSEPSGVKPPEDIDSGLLQTCRRAYEEAISILYGENTFVFSEKYGMILFQTSGVNWLGITKSSQSKHGRLNLIRRASLEMRPYTTFEDLYGDWSTFIDPDRNEIHFPALEVLEVDCSMLGLPDEEVPMVNMFIAKIATFGKLKRLSVPGITHKPTLQRMKEELVREDGVLESTIEEEWESW